MKDSKHKALCQQYFETWNQNNVNLLAGLFAMDINLTDWEISADGLFDVMAANQKIFDSVATIRAEVSEMIQDDENPHRVVCTLTVFVDEGTSNPTILSVVDIIQFNDAGKISSIRAYKG